MHPVRWNTNESNGESHASLESFETNFNQAQNNNNNNNNNNNFFLNNNNDNNNNNNKPVFNCCKVESRLAEKQIGAKYLEVWKSGEIWLVKAGHDLSYAENWRVSW